MTTSLQNISIPRNNDATVTCNVTTADPMETLTGCTITWSVYAQQYGVPVLPATPLFTKSTGGGEITIPGAPTPMQFLIALAAADTAALATGNYYHEALVVDTISNRDDVVCGMFTITQSENA